MGLRFVRHQSKIYFSYFTISKDWDTLSVQNDLKVPLAHTSSDEKLEEVSCETFESSICSIEEKFSQFQNHIDITIFYHYTNFLFV